MKKFLKVSHWTKHYDLFADDSTERSEDAVFISLDVENHQELAKQHLDKQTKDWKEMATTVNGVTILKDEEKAFEVQHSRKEYVEIFEIEEVELNIIL